MGMLAIIAVMLLFLFATKQVTDTETPRVAALTHDVLQRNLTEGSETKLVLRSLAGASPRHYELTLQPAVRLAEERAALDKLMVSAAEIVLEELGSRKGDTTVTCVAVLPEGEKRVTYDRRMQQIPEPQFPAAASAADPE